MLCLCLNILFKKQTFRKQVRCSDSQSILSHLLYKNLNAWSTNRRQQWIGTSHELYNACHYNLGNCLLVSKAEWVVDGDCISELPTYKLH